MKRKTTIFSITTLALLIMAISSYADRPLKGTIYYHDNANKPVSGVLVKLYDATGVTLIDETSTNAAGKYIFENIPYGQYKIVAEDCSIEPGGVEEMDEMMIQDIIDGLIIPTPIQELAADINQNGYVEANDIALFEQLYPDNYIPEWVFTTLPIIDHNGTKTQVPTMGGSSSGDVNGTFVPTGRNERLVETSYFAKQFSRNFTIEIKADDLTYINGMGLVIEIPDNVVITKVTSQIDQLNHVRLEENRAIILWQNRNAIKINSSEPIVTLHGSVNKNYNGEDIRFTLAEDCHFISNGELFTPVFSVPYLIVVANNYLSHCYPNPATSLTRIYFTLPSATNTQVNIYNLTGQLVKKVVDSEFPAGQHSVDLPVTDLKEGVYLYNLTTKGENPINQSKRLVVVH